MTDTPEHVKAIQQSIWLSKSPKERLRQMMIDNESLFQFWGRAIKPVEKAKQDSVTIVTVK